MSQPEYDVIVIGAGPAGSAVATFLAREGHRVLIVERDEFPRFKIGESLIPATFPVLERLGVVDQLQKSPFPKKYSVQFYSQSGKASAPFYFSETEPEEQSQTWQVLRSEFDLLLLQNARENGVEVQTGVSVREILFDRDQAVGVKIQNGASRNISCRLVIDASGQRAILARQLKIQRQDPRLKMAAVFTHFENAQRDEGIDEGATLILHTKNKDSWFWYIPLPDNRVSFGVVGPIEHMIHGRQGNPQLIFDEEMQRCPGLVPRLENARQAMPMKVLGEFSYSATRAAGDGWMLIGDAFCFLDPIYSSGVLLALASAEHAADAALEALEADDLSGRRLGTYEPKMREGIKAFRHLVYAFYDPRFSFAGFLRRYPEHRSPVVKILVGDVFDRDFEAFFNDLETFINDSAGPSEIPDNKKPERMRQPIGTISRPRLTPQASDPSAAAKSTTIQDKTTQDTAASGTATSGTVAASTVAANTVAANTVAASTVAADTISPGIIISSDIISSDISLGMLSLDTVSLERPN